MVDFKDQAVIVTGAGRGLGRLYALEFARRGAAVVVNDLGGATTGGGSDSTVAGEVVQEIEAAGGRAIASHDSVATPDGAARIVEAAMDSFGRVDALVHNAGILATTPFDEISVDQWRQTLSVHLDGGFYLSQPAFRIMKKQGYGRIVLTSSSAGMFGQDYHAHYAAAKTGLFGLKNVIAQEGAMYGILANTILPFGVTRMMTEGSSSNEALMELPFMKLLESDLVVPMVVYLASRDCTVTHMDFSAAAGRYSRAFLGLCEGWLSEKGSKPTADDIGANIGKITSPDTYSIPMNCFDETLKICADRGVEFVIPGMG